MVLEAQDIYYLSFTKSQCKMKNEPNAKKTHIWNKLFNWITSWLQINHFIWNIISITLPLSSQYISKQSSETVCSMILKVLNYFHLMVLLEWDPVESVPLISANCYIGSKWRHWESDIIWFNLPEEVVSPTAKIMAIPLWHMWSEDKLAVTTNTRLPLIWLDKCFFRSHHSIRFSHKMKYLIWHYHLS